MIYKSLFLVVVFALSTLANISSAQTTLCDIEDAVEAVYEAAGEDYDVGNSLNVHLEKLQNWCDKPGLKPFKSKVSNILGAMASNVEERLAEQGYFELVDEVEVWVEMPQEVNDALEVLAGWLLEEFECACAVE